MPPIFPGSPLKPLKGAIQEGRARIRQAAEDLRSFSLTESQATPRATVAEGQATYGVSDRDTLLYQLDHLVSILKQMEIHLAEGCKIMGVPCDCCGKHGLEARTFAMETISIAARTGKDTKIYQDIADWAAKIEEIDTPEKVNSGEYDEVYREESGTASKFRKQMQSILAEVKKGDEGCPGCDELRESISEFLEQKRRGNG